MADLLHRIAPDLEVRTSGEGRTVYGLLVPWDQTTRVDDSDGRGAYDERFLAGAFARTIAERGHRVKLRANHQRIPLPVGRFHLLREDSRGLYGEAPVSKTSMGDDVLELVRDGALDAFSVGFRPIRERRARDGAVERVEVSLREVSLTDMPAYDGALVAGVRSNVRTITAEAAQRRLALLERL